jgi:hypothetical protein
LETVQPKGLVVIQSHSQKKLLSSIWTPCFQWFLGKKITHQSLVMRYWFVFYFFPVTLLPLTQSCRKLSLPPSPAARRSPRRRRQPPGARPAAFAPPPPPPVTSSPCCCCLGVRPPRREVVSPPLPRREVVPPPLLPRAARAPAAPTVRCRSGGRRGRAGAAVGEVRHQHKPPWSSAVVRGGRTS